MTDEQEPPRFTRMHADDPDPTEQMVIDLLVGLPLDRFRLVVFEALGRRELDLAWLELEPPPYPPRRAVTGGVPT